MNNDIGFCGMTIMEKDFKSNKVKSRQYDEEKVVLESFGFDIISSYIYILICWKSHLKLWRSQKSPL